MNPFSLPSHQLYVGVFFRTMMPATCEASLYPDICFPLLVISALPFLSTVM